MTGIKFSLRLVEKILLLYPDIRSELALEGIDEYYVQEEICDMLAHFFLGSFWPREKDENDLDTFLEASKYQVHKMDLK
ncbi:hypothetical protein [Candidatus Odyssella acanthamoebae]|uniref:Uncharacterized protein n=1 Tax=Candidatus Odyssella acanthamoebae TaxID=91604 RepID=A0A077AW51_9PROT|nr:hypothetical protein [Candidatus Paracaedibacter acanthamoebae]AIK96279.1 hypothetical protein ID47_05285 [Candidatus Paracaedibacter acanthamoebae]